MLKAKKELEVYLEKKILSFISDTVLYNRIYNYALEKYSIPKVIVSDYLSLRNPLAEANDFILFCLLDSIENITEAKKSVIPEFYVEKEIKKYSTSKYKVDKIKFPLRFKALQITNDQWLSSINFKTLMQLRAAQLIIYNENTQRTMQRMVRDEKEIYKISINKIAVAEIENLYKDGTYIPTPLTVNIPLDSDSDFYYDEERCELIITSFEGFDIVDGYHRYLAACKASDSDKNINFTMELRIVNFPEDKAQQFIYQEDQKTVMTKADSNTYDQTNLVNRIIERLNSSPQSNIQGLISRNQGLINYADLAELIKYFYINGNKIKSTNSSLVKISSKLIEDFNLLTEYDIKHLEQKYSYKKLFTVMFCFKHFEDKDKSNMCKVIDKILDKSNKLDTELFYKGRSKKNTINRLEEIIEEVL